jgi:hypothetical protein
MSAIGSVIVILGLALPRYGFRERTFNVVDLPAALCDAG